MRNHSCSPQQARHGVRRPVPVHQISVWFTVFALVLIPAGVRAANYTNLVDVQFLGAPGSAGAPPGGYGVTQSGAAFFGVAGDQWNAIAIPYYVTSGTPISGAPLNFSDGTASGLTLTVAQPGNSVFGNHESGTATDASTANLMGTDAEQFIVTSTNYWNFSIGGLSAYAGAQFKLAIYAGAPSAQKQTIHLTGGGTGGNSGFTLTTSSTSRQISAGIGVAYNRFTGGTLTGGNLSFTLSGPNTVGNFGAYVNGFQLQIITPDPAILTQPVSQSVAPGGTVSFSATTLGTAPLSYQWQAGPVGGGSYTNLMNGPQIGGATNATLTISNATANWALAYVLVVTNSNGSVTSSPVTLSTGTVLINADFNDGATATQTGGAVLGTSNDFWNPITGSTSTVFSSANANLGGVGLALTGSGFLGFYDDPYGTAIDVGTTNLMRDYAFGNGSAVTVSVSGLATYIGYPFTLVIYGAGDTTGEGDTLALTAGAVGGNSGSPLTTSAISRSLATPGVAYQTYTGTLTDGTLTFVANGLAPSPVLNGFQLQLQAPDPFITVNPASQTVAQGTTVSFVVVAKGSGPISYQWQAGTGGNFTNMVNGGTISGATSNVLTLSNVDPSWALNYQVVVANGDGTVTSTPAATLTVAAAPLITNPPASQRVVLGRDVLFNVAALGPPTLSYQWQASGGGSYTNLTDGGQVSGSGSPTLVISNVTVNWGLNYRVVVANGYGSATSAPPATLTLDPAIRLINGDFGASATQTGAAVLGSTGDVWNALTASTNALVDSAGNTVSGAGLTLSDQGLFTDTGGTTMDSVTTSLMQDFTYANASPTLVTLSLNGLGEYLDSAFTLVIYAAGDTNGEGDLLTLAGTTGGNSASPLTTAGDTRQISAGVGHAYNVFTGIITNNTLTLTCATNGLNPNAVLNGFQLQLIPLSNPAIWSSPVSQYAYPGDTVSFSVTAVGTAPFNYQWQAAAVGSGRFANLLNGGLVSGANSNVLTLTNVTANSTLDYRVIVTNVNSSTTSSVATLTVPAGWRLVWDDDFNGTALDPAKWTPFTGNDTGGNVYYTGRTNNVYVANGMLHLVAQQESMGGFGYTSAQLRTDGLYWKQYGLIVARIKQPPGDGFWPSWWMLGKNYDTIGWPYCGEVDIMECFGYPTQILGSLHFADVSGNNIFEGLYYNLPTLGDTTANFHTYAIQWTSNSIAWQVDGVNVQTWTNWGAVSGPFAYPAPFNQPFFFLLNLAVNNGSFANTTFPSEMLVDYVHVFDPVPVLNLQASQGSYVLTWSGGSLLEATNLWGPWTTNNAATSPYTVTPNASVPQKFYRVQSP